MTTQKILGFDIKLISAPEAPPVYRCSGNGLLRPRFVFVASAQEAANRAVMFKAEEHRAAWGRSKNDGADH